MIPRAVFEQTVLGFLRPVRAFLDDPTVSEIMINGPFEIWVERGGRLTRTDARFESHEDLRSALCNVAQYVGRPLGAEHPILEARLPDGSRVEAILPPAAPDGPSVSIRRFHNDELSADTLIELGSVTYEAMQLLGALVAAKRNVVVAGGTASGKTSLLNVLSSFIPAGERVVVIEDARELQLRQPHVVHLEAQPPDARGRGAVTIRSLFRATLRMRPDRIVVGEIRGGEALDLVQAMTSGHGGCLTTVHASHPRDTISRLETMALMSDVELPLFALRAQLGSAIDVIVHTGRQADGARCVTHIAELIGYDDRAGYELQDLFVRRYDRPGADGRVRSRLVPTGATPACVEALRAAGFELSGAR